MTKACVLYVEDEENDVLLMRRAFRHAGVAAPLKVVSNGQEAINYLSGYGEFADRTEFPLPTLVLLDIKMPYRSGLEVLEWIRSQSALHALVAVIFTSSCHQSDVEHAYRLGANSFIVKPSQGHELIDFAKALNTWWLHFNVCLKTEEAVF